MQVKVLKTKEQRQDFLENDFLDRLIRIEQRVSAKFGKLIRYTNTYCYRNLTEENRKNYERYLKTKRKKRFVFVTSFILPLLGVLFLSNGITGNVVREGVGESGFIVFIIILLSFLLGLSLSFGMFFIFKLKRERRFGPLFKPLEKIAKKDL